MNHVRFNDRLLSPSKIVCVGRNYVEHIHELGNEIPEHMVLFIKPNSAITASLTAFHGNDKLHYEGEIAYLYQGGKFVAAGFGFDLTKRAVQSALKAKSLPWERSKAFNGSAVFSEFVLLPENAQPLGLTLYINDRLVQQGDTTLMLYQPDEILAEIQTFIQLEDGDIVMTGTPKGVGRVKAGDVYTGALVQNGQLLVRQSWLAQER